MKNTYTKIQETKNHSILHGLNSEIRTLLLQDYLNGNIQSITIKNGGYINEEVIVTKKNNEKQILSFINGKWVKKEV